MSADRIRIARVVPLLDFGGLETRVALQAELHDPNAYELRIFAMKKDGAAGARARAAGVQVEFLDVDPSVRARSTTDALVAALRKYNPTLIHASAAEGNFHSALAGNLIGSKSIVAEEIGLKKRGPTARAVFAGLYRTVDALLVMSEGSRELLERTEWAPAGRTRVIVGCAQPQFFEPLSRSWDQKGPFRFLTTGRLSPEKNIPVLIDVMASLGGDCRLDIAGDGVQRDELEQRARDFGVADRVRFLGFRSDVLQLLDDCDAFVLPSYGEGCSNSLLEAMARGVPVIASSAPSNPEVMGALGPEWGVEPRSVAGWVEGFRRLIAMSSEERQQHGLAGRAIATKRFSPAVYLTAVENMYRDVIVHSPSPVRRACMLSFPTLAYAVHRGHNAVLWARNRD